MKVTIRGSIGGPAAQTKPPSLAKQAVSFAKATVKHVATGCRNAPADVIAERLRICGGCEHFTGTRCLKCGCGSNLKTSWADSECPVGKWGPVTV